MSPEPSTASRFDETYHLLLAEVPDLTGLRPRESASPAKPGTTESLVVGSIGFDGDGMSGALTLAAPPAVWKSIAPDLGPSPVEMLLVQDMVGELCNLMVGRFRNSLLRRGVQVRCATPISRQAALTGIDQPATEHSSWSVLDAAGGEVYLRLDVTFGAGFAFEGQVVEPNVEDLLFF